MVHRDKPTLMPSEILLLFWVKIGVDSPYLIFSLAGLPTGATSPALKRLELLGLLKSVKGPRQYGLSYTVTAEGDALLKLSLEAGPDVYGRRKIGSRYQSLQRAIFFAWAIGKPDEALASIESAEKEIRWQAGRAESEASHYRDRLRSDFQRRNEKERADYVSAFRMIVAIADAAELTSQLNALGPLRKLVGELPPPPDLFLQRQPSPPSKKEAVDKGGKRNRGK
jgi:DNA-binding PadR family transcriptional regulator